MKSGRSGALEPAKLNLSCKANEYSRAGAGGLGVLTSYETPSMDILLVMLAHPVPSECCHNTSQ